MDDIQKQLEKYYANNAKNLRRLVDNILYEDFGNLINNTGGIYQKDLDDFYSIANEVCAMIVTTYDFSQEITFTTYLKKSLIYAFIDEIKRRKRDKRIGDRFSISINTPLGDDENYKIADTLMSDFDIEQEALEQISILSDKRLKKYLNKLSEKQRKIVRMLSQGFKSSEIKEILHITNKEYINHMKEIRAYENIILIL